MPIVSSIVAQTHDRGDGVTRVREVHTFHNGVKRNRRYKAATGIDHTILLVPHAVTIAAKEIADEAANFEAFIEAGGSPDGFTRDHHTASAFIKKMIRAFMKTRDPLLALPVARWMKNNLTNTQIDAKVPFETRQKVRSRITNLLAMQDQLEDDVNHIVKVPKGD